MNAFATEVRRKRAAAARKGEAEPKSSPWGQVQTALKIGPGLWTVSTASHGGIKVVTDEQWNRIPAAFREKAEPGRWFEEDCAATIPLFFCEVYEGLKGEQVKPSLIEWYWPEWEAHTGEIIDPANCHRKREYLWRQANRNSWTVTAAFGGGMKYRGRMPVPFGLVGVVAKLGGREGPPSCAERFYFVAQDKYDAREFSYVIEPTDEPWPEDTADDNEKKLAYLKASGIPTGEHDTAIECRVCKFDHFHPGKYSACGWCGACFYQ